MRKAQSKTPKKLKEQPKETEKKETEAPKKLAATEADFFAVALHQAREAKIELRRQLLAKEKKIVELQTQLGVANQTIMQLEISMDERDNAELRREHKFEVGRSIERDAVTGEIFWKGTP